MKTFSGNVTVQNKRYSYTIEDLGRGTVFFACTAANIAQEFLKGDVVDLLIDLPNLIVAEKEHERGRSEVVRFRISPSDKHKMEQKAQREGYATVSEYLRSLAL